MKKVLLTIFSTIFLISAMTVSSFAANTKYTIDDMNLSLSIPEDYATLTRDVKESDPNIKLFGYDSPEAVVKMLKSYNAYLNTSPKDGGFGILLTMSENSMSKDFFDLNLLNKSELQKLVDKTMKNSLEDIKYSDYKIYQHKQAKFIVFNGVLSDSKATSYVTQYFTIFNGQSININLYSYNQPATDVAKQAQKDIVDSISFTKTLDRPFSIFNPTGKTYVDNAIVCLYFVAIIAIGMLISKQKKKKAIKK